MSFSSFLSGRIGILTSPYSYDGTDSSIPIIIDPSNGSIKCNNIIGNVNATVNLDSINANINTLFNTTNSQSNHIGNLNTATVTLFTTTNAQSNHISNLNTSTLTLFTTTNSQANTLDDHNEYFNDINVAILGLDGAVEQAQNDIINLQSNINVLVNVDGNLQNSINLLVNTDTNQQNQINGLILTDMSIQNSINLLVNTDANLQNSINLLINTDANLQNSVNTNQLLVSGANLQFKVNLSSSPQVSLNANGVTLPFLSVERNFAGDYTQAIHEPAGLGIIHSYTTVGSESVPYLSFSDNVINKTSSIYFGSADPNVNISPDGGSMYLRNNGDILMGDGANWISYLGALSNFNSEINALQSIVSFRDSQEIFVSADGSDISGNGSSLQPYATIQKAIMEAELVASSSSQVSIYVGAGTYIENLLISTGYISIIGETSTAIQSGSYGIVGDISINIAGTNNLNGNFVILQGLVVYGSVVQNSTAQHSTTLQDCRIIVPNTRSYATRFLGNTVNKRVRIINCQMFEESATGFSDSFIFIQGGWLYLERCDLTTRSAITAVELEAGSYLPRMALCSIEAGSNSASLPPQIYFNQDSGAPINTIQSIGQTTIVASNPAGLRPTGLNGSNTAIYFRTGQPSTTLAIQGVIIGIFGNITGNDIIQNFHATAFDCIHADFYVFPGTAQKFGSNINKVNFVPVN